ncbi:MAG: transglutaminase-like domain-containing protein [Bacillota bacterium]|nr:transglutaminase-like domain-containing protein [Bacillota bacterium]
MKYRNKLFGFIKSFLTGKLARILIFFSIFIEAVIAGKFYTISGTDYLIILFIMLCSIIIEKMYSQIFMNKYFRITILSLLGIAYVVYMQYLNFNTLEKVFKFFSDLNMKVYYSQPIDFYYILPAAIPIVGFITFLWLRLDRLNKGNWFLVLQYLFLCNVSFYTYDYEIYMGVSVLILIVYMCINIYRNIKVRAIGQRLMLKLNIKRIVLYYSVIISLVFISAVTLIQITGYKSTSEIRKIMNERVLKNVDDNMKKLYDLSNDGYGDKWRLGGPLKVKEDNVFRVESDKPYYLKGNIKDEYTGSHWEKMTNNFFVSDRPITMLLQPEVQARLLGKSPNDPFREPKNLTVYNESMESTSLFTPNNTVIVTAPRKTVGSSADNLYMLLDKELGMSYYNVSFYESSTGMDDFRKFHDNGMKFDYDPVDNSTPTAVAYDDVKTRYDKFLQIPISITNRTRELEKQITSNSKSEEDKIYGIMQYLRNNYPYEVNVSRLPEDRDFVDYFLFDEKKGYCTYFATTAVMLCRMEGIPARYVEGFAMTPVKDSDGLYVVKSNMAHAWCEVLVSAKYNLWAVLECTPTIPKPGSDVVEKSNENISKLKSSKGEAVDVKAFTDTKVAVVNKIKTFSISLLKVLLYIVIAATGIALVFGMIHLSIRKWTHMAAVRRIFKSDKINLLYYHTKDRLVSLGIDNRNSQSEHEYLNNIEDDKLKGYLEEIANIYEQQYYGGKDVEVFFDKRKYYKKIEKYIRKKQNILRYYIDKYELDSITFFWNKEGSNEV